MDMAWLKEIINKKKSVIFDFDWTIVSLHTDWKLVKKEINNYLQSINYDNQLVSINRDFQNIFDDIKNINYEFALNILSIIELIELQSWYEPIEPIIGLINEINWKEIHIFSNNFNSTIEKILIELWVYNKFDIIVWRWMVRKFKPAPEWLEYIVWNWDKNDYILIWDSDIDKIVANDCSIDFYKI